MNPTENRENQSEIRPVIVSASRVTDLPAFHKKWFQEQLDKGFTLWRNPYNRRLYKVSFENTRLFVFWSKNPVPFINELSVMEKMNYGYYFQFTLNDYESEGYEPNLPSLSERIETFIKLSEKIGKDKVIWRFDPLIISEKTGVLALAEKIRNIARKIKKHTKKLVVSFVDINKYRKVRYYLSKVAGCREFTEKEMLEMAEYLSEIKKESGLEIATCAEKIRLEDYGINHNRCIDDELIGKVFSGDNKLMEYIRPCIEGKSMKDRGQRKDCGCIPSKDIGWPDSCPHGCIYCYSNG